MIDNVSESAIEVSGKEQVTIPDVTAEMSRRRRLWSH